MKNKKNLIVFDIDGTVTDTVPIHQNAFKNALQLMGVSNYNDSFGTYLHHTDSYIAKEIFELNTKLIFNESKIEAFETYMFESIKNEKIKEINGAKKIINQIETETNFGIVYATGSLLKPAIFKLENIGIKFEPIQLIASNHIMEREKIVKQAILNAQALYKVEKFERIISIGDGLWDLKTAKNMSIEFIGLGSQNEKIMKNSGLDKHYLDFASLSIDDLLS